MGIGPPDTDQNGHAKGAGGARFAGDVKSETRVRSGFWRVSHNGETRKGASRAALGVNRHRMNRGLPQFPRKSANRCAQKAGTGMCNSRQLAEIPVAYKHAKND
jgi:hypothetical protein